MKSDSEGVTFTLRNTRRGIAAAMFFIIVLVILFLVLS